MVSFGSEVRKEVKDASLAQAQALALVGAKIEEASAKASAELDERVRATEEGAQRALEARCEEEGAARDAMGAGLQAEVLGAAETQMRALATTADVADANLARAEAGLREALELRVTEEMLGDVTAKNEQLRDEVSLAATAQRAELAAEKKRVDDGLSRLTAMKAKVDESQRRIADFAAANDALLYEVRRQQGAARLSTLGGDDSSGSGGGSGGGGGGGTAGPERRSRKSLPLPPGAAGGSDGGVGGALSFSSTGPAAGGGVQKRGRASQKGGMSNSSVSLPRLAT